MNVRALIVDKVLNSFPKSSVSEISDYPMTSQFKAAENISLADIRWADTHIHT